MVKASQNLAKAPRPTCETSSSSLLSCSKGSVVPPSASNPGKSLRSGKSSTVIGCIGDFADKPEYASCKASSASQTSVSPIGSNGVLICALAPNCNFKARIPSCLPSLQGPKLVAPTPISSSTRAKAPAPKRSCSPTFKLESSPNVIWRR